MQFVKAARLLAAPLIVVLASLSWSSVSWADCYGDGYSAGLNSCPAAPICQTCPAATICPAAPICETCQTCPAATICPAAPICETCQTCPAATICPTAPICETCPACPAAPTCPVATKTLTVLSSDPALGTVTLAGGSPICDHTKSVCTAPITATVPQTFTLTAAQATDAKVAWGGKGCTLEQGSHTLTLKDAAQTQDDIVCVATFTTTPAFNASSDQYVEPAAGTVCNGKSIACVNFDKEQTDSGKRYDFIYLPSVDVEGQIYAVGMKRISNPSTRTFMFHVDQAQQLRKLIITGNTGGGTVSVTDAAGKEGKNCGRDYYPDGTKNVRDCYAFPDGTNVTVTAKSFSGNIDSSVDCDGTRTGTVALTKNETSCSVTFTNKDIAPAITTTTTKVTLDNQAIDVAKVESSASGDCTKAADTFTSTTGKCDVKVTVTVKPITSEPTTPVYKLIVLSNDTTIGKVMVDGKECKPSCIESTTKDKKSFVLTPAPVDPKVKPTWEGCTPAADGKLDVTQDTVCIAKFTKANMAYHTVTLKVTGPGTVSILSTPAEKTNSLSCTSVSGKTCDAIATLPEGTEFSLAGTEGSKNNTCTGKQTLSKDIPCEVTFADVPDANLRTATVTNQAAEGKKVVITTTYVKTCDSVVKNGTCESNIFSIDNKDSIFAGYDNLGVKIAVSPPPADGSECTFNGQGKSMVTISGTAVSELPIGKIDLTKDVACTLK